jgi:Ras family protein T1
VTSLIKESFVAHVNIDLVSKNRTHCATQTQVQHIVPEVTIPPEVTPENVTTYIVDSGGVYQAHGLVSQSKFYPTAGPQDRAHLESEIRKAHVICVVYSIDNPNSFDRIPTFWLPHFRQLGVNVILLSWLRNQTDERFKGPGYFGRQ